jgi:guanine deaminase
MEKKNTSYREQFMKEAIGLSREKMRAGCGGPFGALIVRDGQVIARGWNQVTTLHDPTAHAEVVAIREACRVLKAFHLTGCEIYSSCEPCPMCLAAIYWARLERLYFAGTRTDAAEAGFDDEFLYRELNAPLSERRIATEQVLRPEAVVVFQEWRRKADKILY